MHEDAHERGPGPELANYAGIPITDGARIYGLAWNASRFTIPEHQCEVHILSYIYRGPYNLRIWEERDPVSQKLIAIKQYIDNYQQSRTIWMDGRSHPPDAAPHTWMGFSTGKWEGNILTVYTTHLKWGWIRRNGLRHTDQATLTEHFIRHGDHLTHTSILTDPATLTEPLIKTTDLVLRLQNGQAWLYPCEPVVEIVRPKGTVPHYPFIDVERGGSIQGEVDALNNLLELAIPGYQDEGGTYVIPGDGFISDRPDLLEYRDMVTIIRDRVQAAIKKGMTLEQVKAAGLTKDYDNRYSSKSGSSGTGAAFVETIFKSLAQKR